MRSRGRGPPDGLTLDEAIERLVHENLGLRARSFELPQAEADILTASLRANPLLYADSQLIPYGSYSPQRPGGPVQYDINITYPLDVTHKRKARTRRRASGEAGARGPVPGRRPAPDRQPLHRLHRRARGPRDDPVRRGRPRGAGHPARPNATDVRERDADDRRCQPHRSALRGRRGGGDGRPRSRSRPRSGTWGSS